MADELSISIGADPSGLRKGINDAENIVDQFALKLSKLGNIGDELTSLGSKLSASLTLPIVGLGVAAIKSYGDIQSLQKGLEAVSGSVEEANKQFEDLKEVAKLPGLGLQEAVKGAINLRAIGLSAEKSKGILLQVGNAIATVGKGREDFERAIYGFQQLANTDFPLGEDLNIIKDALPQVSNLLKDAFGTSRSEELKAMGKTSKEVLDVIISGLTDLPRVSGGLNGAFENLSDSIKTSLGRIGKIIDDNINISGIIDRISSTIESLISGFESLDPTLQKIILGMVAFTAAAGPILVAIGGIISLIPTLTVGIGAVAAGFTFLLSPIGLVTVALVGVVAAVVANWDKIRPYLEETIERFKRLYNESALFRVNILAIGSAFEIIARTSVIALKNIYENVKDVGKAILRVFNGIGEQIEGIFTLNFDKVKSGAKKSLAGFLTGGGDVNVNNLTAINDIGNVITTVDKKWSSFRLNLGKKTNLNLEGLESLGDSKGFDISKFLKSLNLLKDKSNGLKDISTKPLDSLTSLKDKAAAVSKEIQDIKPLAPFSFSNGFDANKEYNDVLKEQIRLYTALNDLYNQNYAGVNGLAERLNADVITLSASQIAMQSFVDEFNSAASQILNQGVIDGIYGAAEALGGALASGQNLVTSVGASLLSTLGGILVQLGKLAIQTGIGILAVKLALKSLNPYLAIAAGIALVALGSAFKGGAGNLSNSIGGSGSGGGYSSDTGGTQNSSYSSSYTSGGSFGSGEVVFRIEGQDLVGVLNRATNTNNRLNASS